MRQPIEDAVSVRGAAKFEAGHDERIAQTGIFQAWGRERAPRRIFMEKRSKSKQSSAWEILTCKFINIFHHIYLKFQQNLIFLLEKKN